MASSETTDESLYPIAVLIDELRNEDVQVFHCLKTFVSLNNSFRHEMAKHDFLRNTNLLFGS